MNSKLKNQISKTRFIQIVDNCIQNMGTKGVYHPKRLKPKWNSLTKNSEKLALLEKYVTNKKSSVGFKKLIKVKLCQKTLEAIIVENPNCVDYLSSSDVRSVCIEKFSKYINGREYLIQK